MRDITEELSRATEVPYTLWEFEDLMKKTGDLKHKSTEEIDDEYKKRVHRKDKRVHGRSKKKNKQKEHVKR